MLHFLHLQQSQFDNYRESTYNCLWFQEMSRGNDNSRPLGICHRLINFIINNLIGPGHKRVSLGGGAPPPRESTELPITCGSSRNIKITPPKSNTGNGALRSEVVIDFRHIEEPKISTTSVPKLSSDVDFSKKNGFISIGDRPLLRRAKERRRFDAKGTDKDHGVVQIELPGPTKGKERAEDRSEKYKQKEKVIPTETSSRNESEEGKRNHLMRPSRPRLTSVASNINEKADDFIRSRRETMSKHYGFEQSQESCN